jgi:cyclopropane-fatty-acyl-phospholipid synthase
MTFATDLAERGFVPDWLSRRGIRGLLRNRIQRESGGGASAQGALFQRYGDGPLAVNTLEANEQHYEVPPEFFELVLGHRLKYSSCWFDEGNEWDLDRAEDAMLDRSIVRAGLVDGMRILELGCGWGSLTRTMARRFPNSEIVAVSNSAPQRRFIESRLSDSERERVTIHTADLNDFQAEGSFDRVVSIECFEHLRNWAELFKRISGWLNEDGRLFFHVFCHRRWAYPFEVDGDRDWMAKHFFTGGHMPSFDQPKHFNEHLSVEQSWEVDGRHYERTSACWLKRLDDNRQAVLDLLTKSLGPTEARRQYRRWRLFFLACEECFGYADGSEWIVGHYLLRPNSP